MTTVAQLDTALKALTVRVLKLEQAAQPVPTTGRVFGLASHPMWYGHWQADIDRMATAGLRYLRMDVGWRWLEPTKGVRDAGTVAKLDAVIAAARARGLTISVTVIETPSWLGSTWTPPPPADYAAIVGWLAARYKGKVAAWEVWNEPNAPEFWASGTSDRARNSAQYAAILRAAYPAIKAGDPAALVLGGSVLFNDADWLAGLVMSGAPYDALAIHPYCLAHAPDDRTEVYFSFRGQIEGMHAATGKDLWLTECGWDSRVSETTRATYLAALVAAARSYPYVKAVAVYTDDYTLDAGTWAVLGTDGSPLPSWTAYVTASA